MIIDEADLCLEKILTLTEDGDLNGLFLLRRALKCYFFTATMSDYMKELVSQVVGAYESLEFKSQYQLSNDSPLPYSIDWHLVHKGIYVDRVCEYIKSRKGKNDLKPMMIFVEKPDNALTTKLEDAVRHTFGNKMFVIKNPKELADQQNIIRNTAKGAVLLTKDFGRGINLRFLSDSEVIVLVNKDYLGAPLIKQMVGRSSRRTGLCYGKVFITTEYELGNSQDGAEATQWARED